MKRFISILLTAVLILSTVSVFLVAIVPTFAAVDTSSLKLIYNNYHDITNLVNPIANVQKVSSVTSANLKNLSVAYIDLTTGIIDAKTAYQACVNANVLPTFYITTNAQADSVASAITAVGKTDVNVISDNKSVVQYMRGKNCNVRTGLVWDLSSVLSDGVITETEGNNIRMTVRGAPATFIVIDSKYATQHAVYEMQQYQVNVWVNIESQPGTDAFKTEVVKALTSGANGVISTSASQVSNIANTIFLPNAITRTPIVFGHSGNPAVAPENTMESFIAAYNNGADYLELDTAITKDGVVVLLHDHTLTRTTTYTGTTQIYDMTWAEVQQYHVLDNNGKSTGKPIPTLEELLQYIQGKNVKLYMEFKTLNNDIVPTALNLVKKYGLTEQVSCVSFYGGYIGHILTNIGSISTGIVFNNDKPSSTYAEALDSLGEMIDHVQYYKSSLGPQNPANSPLTRHYIQAATDRGMNVNVWTYGPNNTGTSLFVAPDGITTNHADSLAPMTRFVHAENFSMFVGQTYFGGTVTAEAFNHSKKLIPIEETVATVLLGDSVKFENGKLVAVKEGVSTVIFGHKTKTYSGEEYIVYSQPVNVTVGDCNASILEPFVTSAKTATINSLSESDLQKLRDYTEKAEELIKNNSKDTETISEIATALSELIDKFVVLSYTTTAFNYSNTLFEDDEKRLIDGAKAFNCGNDAGYSAWQKTSTGNVEITLKYSTSVTRDVFNAYFAGDEWGVKVPSNMSISYSQDGYNWTKVNATTAKTQTLDSTTQSDGIWDLWTYSVTSPSPISAKYFKFTITSNGNFIWVDEVEALNTQNNLIYVNNFDQKITSGDCNIFTPDLSPITLQNSNTTYTYNILAKYDAKYDAYVVTQKHVDTSNGLTLKSDEILIAAHDWETNVGKELTPVYGSAKNVNLVKNCEVGQYIQFYGVDIKNRELGIAPSFRFVDKLAPIAKLGDVDGSGEIDSVDYLLIKRNCFGTYTFTDVQKTCADIDKNGKIESVDYLLIKRACFGTYTIN